ncbi:MAG: amino acid permease [Candidatus Atribacteria bacterium]|nr:MAG: amino acid permease [Candidatus Atribacteria bacterium]
MSYKLKKELGLLSLFCIASGAMISSGLFILPGIVFASAGPSVIISYLLASFLMIPAMFSKAELATAMPKAGGNYFFIDRSMGPWMGTLGGLSDWFSLSLKSTFALLGIGIFALILNPGITEMQIKFIAVICCLFSTIVNTLGVKLAGRFQIVMVIALLILLTFYIIYGSFSIQLHRYTPFMSLGLGPVFTTAGFVFISYAGLTKIASIAEEVKNPGRNIPLAMFLSWIIISLLYVLVISITVGLLDSDQLKNSLTPISLGAGTLMGKGGSIVLAVAALLAFATTANAGLLAASRTPMAMSRDELLPGLFGKVSKRGTPAFSIIFTSGFMIFIILFLTLENLVKAASTMILLLFILINLSVIIMRESKIRYYQPKFRSPLYPWIQILGIIGYGFLIFKMGIISLLIVVIFIICALSWYWIYARSKIKREYSLLNVVKRITGIKPNSYLIGEELRKILLERDNITKERFEHLIEKCPVIDLKTSLLADELPKIVANSLAERLKINPDKLFKLLIKRVKESEITIRSGVACLSITIQGHSKFEIILIRDREGITFSDKSFPIYEAFIIVNTPDEHNFYMHSLMWIVKIIEETDFDKKWLNAKNSEELRNIILSLWRKRFTKP